MITRSAIRARLGIAAGETSTTARARAPSHHPASASETSAAAWSQFPRCDRGGKIDVIKSRWGRSFEPSSCESAHVMSWMCVAAPLE